MNSPAISEISTGGSNPKFGTSRDIAGIVLWVLGFLIESVGDTQKVSFTLHCTVYPCNPFFEKYLYKSQKLIPKGKPTEVCCGLDQ